MVWTDVAFAGVYWNDPERVDRLLEHVRPWFSRMVIGVQFDDPTDPTLAVAEKWADEVIMDRVHGFCEPTIGKLLPKAHTDWTFLVSADEWPSDNLLGSFQRMLDEAATHNYDGFWIRMLSSIEGVSFPSEQDNHLRVFKTALGWPQTMHSRPAANNPMFWHAEDILHHDRSLDEMMQDYIRYFRLGAGHPGWEAHNRQMMMDACSAIAQRRGWDYVSAYPWWPTVRDIAFGGVTPTGT